MLRKNAAFVFFFLSASVSDLHNTVVQELHMGFALGLNPGVISHLKPEGSTNGAGY